MMTNVNKNVDANVTVTISGGNTTLGCVGARYAYTPVNTDQDGGLTGQWIYAATNGLSYSVLVPKYSSVTVVFPKR